jgi:hypothetical protein
VAAAISAAHDLVTDRLHKVTKTMEHSSLYFIERVLVAHALIKAESAQYKRCSGVDCDFCAEPAVSASK